MDINQANIDNLTNLWKKYGALPMTVDERTIGYANENWPYRSWLEDGKDIKHLLSAIPSNHVLSLWPFKCKHQYKANGRCDDYQKAETLLDKGWRVDVEQTAMYMNFDTVAPNVAPPQTSLKLLTVSSQQQLQDWLRIGSEAFGYQISESVFNTLIEDSQISLFLGQVADQPVVSALVFTHNGICGLHQFGVLPAFQGQGLSIPAMREIIYRCKQKHASTMVLQASEAGYPLYEKLGFSAQFKIKHFKRI